jgi:hypothetical protein
MKVKYSDQLAYCEVDESDLSGTTDSASLASFFPTLEASDAIMIKRVHFALATDSVDAGLEATAI